jgi:hypothetical protein
MLEEPAAALANSQALRPVEARRPWPEIALPAAAFAALLLDLMSDAHWGNLRLHWPLEFAAAAVALAAAAASWLRCARAIARSRPARGQVFLPLRVCEGTPHVDTVLLAALEFAMARDPVMSIADVASVPDLLAFEVMEASAIPCPPAEEPVRKQLRLQAPFQIEGALVLRRATLPAPDAEVRTQG